MKKQQLLYSGKAKSVYLTDNSDDLIMEYRNDTSAFDGTKVAQFERKGMINNYFNAFIMNKIAEHGILTHFKEISSPTESVVKKLQMVPVECVVRNVAAGGIAKRLGLTEGKELTPPIFEFFYKNDALHDPMINEFHIRTFGWATEDEIIQMKQLSFKINDLLVPLFAKAGFILVDYKLEFGRYQGQLLLGDEFTPDGCRLWDQHTKEKFDKDRFRRDLGSMVEYYEQAATRLGIVLPL